MERCLSYFRDALYRPEQVAFWDDWWMANAPLVKASFSTIDYLRLKLHRLIAAREILTRLDESTDPVAPIRLDTSFLDAIRSIRWFEFSGEPCTVALPFAIESVPSWTIAQASCADPIYEDIQLEENNALTLFLHHNHRARYQRWNEIVAAAKKKCLDTLLEEVWIPYCRRHGLSE